MKKTAFTLYLQNNEELQRDSLIQTYKRGDLIETMGHSIHYIGLVLDGMVRAIRYTDAGRKVTIAFFIPNSIIGEYLYLTNHQKYTYDLLCSRASTVLWIPKTIFRKTVFDHEKGLAQYVAHLAERGQQEQRLVTCRSYRTVRGRVCYWLASEYNDMSTLPETFEIPYSQEVFATLLQVSRTSLNLELHAMVGDGFFKMSRHHLYDFNVDKVIGEL